MKNFIIVTDEEENGEIELEGRTVQDLLQKPPKPQAFWKPFNQSREGHIR